MNNDNKLKETLLRNIANDDDFNDGNNINNRIIDFEDMFDTLNKVPEMLLEKITQAKRGNQSLHSINVVVDGKLQKRFPIQTVFTGVINHVSAIKIKFPNNTEYGTDRFVRLDLENGLSIYVPSRQAGLNQPNDLYQMQGQIKSAVITNIIQKDNKSNSPTVVLGSINSAEYQIGYTLYSQFENNPTAFKDYLRKGIVTGISNKRGKVTISLADNDLGHIDFEMSADQLGYLYSFQKVSDLVGIEMGAPINFYLTNIIKQTIKRTDKDIKGDYYQLVGDRLNLPSVHNNEPQKKVMQALIERGRFDGYIYSITPRNGIRVEVAPKLFINCSISPRIVSLASKQLGHQDVVNHTHVFLKWNNKCQSMDDLKHLPRPAQIVDIDRQYKDQQIYDDGGFVAMLNRN